MEWMEGGKWKVVTHAADQVTGYGQTRGVKRTQGSKLLGAACFPGRCDPGNLTREILQQSDDVVSTDLSYRFTRGESAW